jgi:hypothetical protein
MHIVGPRRLLTESQAADFLQVAESSMAKLRKRDGLTFCRVGGLIRYRVEEDLMAFLSRKAEGSEVVPSPDAA